MTGSGARRHVLILPDGAGDHHREQGLSPLGRAHLPWCDQVARRGVNGRMQTLYPQLPKESLVAQLGMLGWDPRIHYPRGRASCEFLALEEAYLDESDVAFRANLVKVEGGRLESYNAHFIRSDEARHLVDLVSHHLRGEFPDFELFHNSDFRNTLVVRGTWVNVDRVGGPEPHESHGDPVDPAHLVTGSDPLSRALAERLNRYLVRAAELLHGQRANMLYPWSPSRAFRLPAFAAVSGFSGRAAVVANMDFLHGIARAGGIEFFKHGNGRPDTDYAGKGRRVVELLEEGCELVVCHVNAPDEAAHMGDVGLKIHTLEETDRHVVGPVVRYFEEHPEQLGGVLVAPDHYTNVKPQQDGLRRMEVHSIDPVPFALWSGREVDGVERFDEDAAPAGRFGGEPVSHLRLLDLLLGRAAGGAVSVAS